jgi:hypothetical protein
VVTLLLLVNMVVALWERPNGIAAGLDRHTSDDDVFERLISGVRLHRLVAANLDEQMIKLRLEGHHPVLKPLDSVLQRRDLSGLCGESLAEFADGDFGTGQALFQFDGLRSVRTRGA